MNNRIDPASRVGAATNEPAPIPMFKGRIMVQASPEMVDALRNDGWTATAPEDMPAIAAEIETMAAEVGAAFRRWLDGLANDRNIDATDDGNLAAATRGYARLQELIQTGINIAYAVYPVAQREPVTMHGTEKQISSADGEPKEIDAPITISVDPGQVAEFEERGFTRASGRRRS